MESLTDLCSVSFARAFSGRNDIPRLALTTMRATRRQAGMARQHEDDSTAAQTLPSTIGEYAASLASRTVCITLLAGSGSRWVTSLRQAKDRGVPEVADIDPEAPRGLFPVRDFLGRGRAGQRIGALSTALEQTGVETANPARIAVAAYSLDAVDALGHHLVVVRGWENRIAAEVMEPLGIASDRYSFFTQEAAFGKPLGHGDAAWQCRDLWKDAEYVVTNFGGDANSPLTILAGLLALDALNSGSPTRDSRRPDGIRSFRRNDGTASGSDTGLVDFLLPAAPVDNPGYPIAFDSAGRPVSFGHAKLQGLPPAPGPGYTNVGIRIYRAAALYEKLTEIHDRYWREGTGYEIPGNDPAGHEFALDNVDAQFASDCRARVLACANADELTPAKTLDDVPAFEAAIARVRAEWDREKSRILG